MIKRLTFLVCISLFSYLAYAQSDTTIVLDELIINNNRINIPFSEASRNVNIMTKQEIKYQPALSLPEILTYIPAVDVRQRGPVGVQSDISIRGGTFEETLILLNGMKLTDPQTGHHLMNVPVPLDHISQVEVLKGPGARIYGQNAFAGAINFITKVPEDKQIGLKGYGGSFGSYGGDLSLAFPKGKYRQFISYSRNSSDGYRENTDYNINNIFYQSEIEISGGTFEMMAAYVDRKFGADGFYVLSDAAEEYEEVKTGIYGVSYKKKINNFQISPRLYWRRNNDDYIYIRSNPGAFENFHTTNIIGAEVNTTLESRLGITGFGIELRKEMINGETVSGGNMSKSNDDGLERSNFGMFLEQRLKYRGKVDLTPGIYVNWNSDYDWNIFGGMDVGLNVDDHWRIYANVGKSYRIPTYYELFYQGPGNSGNEDLVPEEALTYEAGVRYLFSGVAAEANYFIRSGSETIDWIYMNDNEVFEANNINNLRANGLELSATINFIELINPAFPVYRLNVSYNLLDQTRHGDLENVISKYALEHLKNQLIIGVHHRIFGKLKNNFLMRYIERVDQDPYLLIDDKLVWEENERLQFFLEATNLTDRSYTEVLKSMPGRWVRGGLVLRLEMK